MKIELATIQDVPALLDLQRKAFGPLCEELEWKDAPVLSESLEHAYEEFARCTTLKVQDGDRWLPIHWSSDGLAGLPTTRHRQAAVPRDSIVSAT